MPSQVFEDQTFVSTGEGSRGENNSPKPSWAAEEERKDEVGKRCSRCIVALSCREVLAAHVQPTRFIVALSFASFCRSTALRLSRCQLWVMKTSVRFCRESVCGGDTTGAFPVHFGSGCG